MYGTLVTQIEEQIKIDVKPVGGTVALVALNNKGEEILLGTITKPDSYGSIYIELTKDIKIKEIKNEKV